MIVMVTRRCIKSDDVFDRLKMKEEIRAKIYEDIKELNDNERIAYFRVPPDHDPFGQESQTTTDASLHVSQ